ncbi:L,D-transpeptidase [Variovorax sp. H27-G14]
MTTVSAAEVELIGPADSPELAGAATMGAEFERDVSPRLRVPQDETVAYAVRLQAALLAATTPTNTAPGLAPQAQQVIVLIDRNPHVQAALLYLGSPASGWQFVGATPVSTGLPGRYEHFTTPLGVFDHAMANPDFRAEGTKNKLGFRGYGAKGMRIYDFGWIDAPRGWGKGAMGVMRLQMHATDPALAEPKLGTAQSEGCVRIPSSLNEFIDRNGLLDADYEKSASEGAHLWVLRRDRTPTAWPGRSMVVVDSGRTERPEWSPLPAKH